MGYCSRVWILGRLRKMVDGEGAIKCTSTVCGLCGLSFSFISPPKKSLRMKRTDS